MTKKLKIFIIALLGVIATACICVFAGCKFSYTVDELKEMHGLKAQVTYFLTSEGGSYKENEIFVKHIYYPEGALAYNIGIDKPRSAIELEPKMGYNFSGWYYAQLNADGMPVYADDETKSYSELDDYDQTGENGEKIKSGVKNGTRAIKRTNEKFDFKNTKLKAGEHYYLVGRWTEDVRLRFLLDYKDEADAVEDNGQIKYKLNEVEYTVERDKELVGLDKIIENDGLKIGDIRLNIDGYTIYGFYAKDDKTTPLASDYTIYYPTKPDNAPDDTNYDVEIYVKLIKGSWTIVKDAVGVASLFGNPDGNFYMDANVDCDGAEFGNFTYFAGKIRGNGFTISNFSVKRYAGAFAKGGEGSFLGDIEVGAEIKDITFKDFNITFSLFNNTSYATIRLVCNAVSEEAKISGLNIDNCQMTVSCTTALVGQGGNVDISQNDWLFGEKDEEYSKIIKVTNSSCTLIKDPDDRGPFVTDTTITED